jgi:RNA polymerase sigma-70 factor (ECF subfamily)
MFQVSCRESAGQDGIAVVEDEAELARRCLAGDADAVRTLIEACQRPVFALCVRMLSQREDAEDVAQETLVRVVRYLKTWDSSLPLLPWVLTIAANRCRTALARRGRLSVTGDLAAVAAEPGNSLPDWKEELDLALDRLPAHHRLCFALYYEQELSIAEIAVIQSVPEGTVKTWLYRSRKQLADALRERGYGPRPDVLERSSFPGEQAGR